jgi:hypothetical protein
MFLGEVWDTTSGEHLETGKEVRANAGLLAHAVNVLPMPLTIPKRRPKIAP